MQDQDRLAAQLAATTLVSFGGISKAVAEHDASFRQGGLDDFRQVLGARGEHHRQFRQRRKTGGCSIQQEAANFFSGCGSAWLTRHHHGQSLLAKYARQLFYLGALAAAVESFEGDEAAALMVLWRHAEMINQHLAFGTSHLTELQRQPKMTPPAGDCYIHLS